MFPQAAYFGPAARRVDGPKSATERSHEGGANVAAAICRFPALNFSFVNLVPSIFMVNDRTEDGFSLMISPPEGLPT